MNKNIIAGAKKKARTNIDASICLLSNQYLHMGPTNVDATKNNIIYIYIYITIFGKLTTIDIIYDISESFLSDQLLIAATK